MVRKIVWCVFLLLLILPVTLLAGAFHYSEHGGKDATYIDREYYPGYDDITGVSRAHIDASFASVPRGECYHCHDFITPNANLDWPMTFDVYGTKEEKVDFCGNCHTDTDPDANGIDNDTPAGFSFQGPTKFKQSVHYTRNLQWPGGQYGTSYPQMPAAGAGTCINCHSPHAHAYTSNYASIPAGWSKYDVPYPKQLVELTDINDGPGAIPDWDVVWDEVSETWKVTGWPNVGGRDPDDAEDICYTCHDGDPVSNPDVTSYNNQGGGQSHSANIKDAFSSWSHHPVKDSEQLWFKNNQGGSDVVFKVECTICHNPHLASGHWNDFYDDPTATPLVLPGAAPGWPIPAPAGYVAGEAWGDEPSEKMNGLMQRMKDQLGIGGCGTWKFNVDRGLEGQSPICDQPAIYRAPWGGDGVSHVQQPDGDQLPDIPTFCLDCHQNRVANHNPIYWGKGWPAGTSSYQGQGHEPHGFDSANSSYFGCGGCTAAGCTQMMSGGELFGEPRGLGYLTFTRPPYYPWDRLAGANFVLACTDCHEPHGSSYRNLFRKVINGAPINNMVWNEICNACHYYYGGDMTESYCGGKPHGCPSCHEQTSIHRMKKNHLGNTQYVYKPQSAWYSYECADNGPGIIGVWHFDNNNATSGVTRGNYEDSTVNKNDLYRGHKGAGSVDGPSNGGATQPWSGPQCDATSCSNLFTSNGPFGYSGDQSLNLTGRDGFTFSRSARCHTLRTPDPDILFNSHDPDSEASNFTIEAWIKWSPTAEKNVYAITGRTGAGYHPGLRILLTKWCGGSDVCETGKYYPTVSISVYDKTYEGLNGDNINTDTSRWGDFRAARSWKPIEKDRWTLITVTFDAYRDGNPLRVYMDGMDVTNSEPREMDNAPTSNLNDSGLMPPKGWVLNSYVHPYYQPDKANDPAYCPTCTSHNFYKNYAHGWSFGIEPNVGYGDGTYCGGSLNPSCNWPNPFEGLIDDVRVANSTLSPEEVCARYISGASGVPAPTTVEPGIDISNCTIHADEVPPTTPEPIISAADWKDTMVMINEPYITSECVTTPSDGSATSRGVVAMYQFDMTVNPYADLSGNGGDVNILRNMDGLAWRDVIPGSANSGAGNVEGMWGSSMPGFGEAFQTNGDGYMRTVPVKCTNMRYPDPDFDSHLDITSGPNGNDPNSATQLTVDAWIYPSFDGFSGVYYTGPDAVGSPSHAWPFDPLNTATDRPESMYIFSKLGSVGFKVNSYAFGLGGGCRGDKNNYHLTGRISFWDNDQLEIWRGAYSNISVPLNQWSYVAMTFDAADPSTPIRIYLNGKDVTDISSPDPDVLVKNQCDQPVTGWAMNTSRHNEDCVASTTYSTAGGVVAAGSCGPWWMDHEYYRRNGNIGGWVSGLPKDQVIMPNVNYNINENPFPWFGKIDDLRLHNKTMTADELCSRYKNGLSGIPASLDYETSFSASECY